MPKDNDPQPSNCSDETKREAYLACLKLKQREEAAKKLHDSAMGSYRAELKKWDDRGVDKDAIIYALKVREEDPDELVLIERERIRMLALSGRVPDARNAILSRLDIEEPTRNEESELDLARAHDIGHSAGLNGSKRDENPYPAGSELHVKWVVGWMEGQGDIATRMRDAPHEAEAAPAKRKPGRPRKVSLFQPDTAETVTAAYADDEHLPMPEDAA